MIFSAKSNLQFHYLILIGRHFLTYIDQKFSEVKEFVLKILNESDPYSQI